MDPKGYYSILRVPESATDDQIKSAYRDTAMKYHPDKNKSPLADDMMKKINEAYGILSDKQKRQEYDNDKNIGENFRSAYYNVHNKRSSNNTNRSTKKTYNYNYKHNFDYEYNKNTNDYSKNKVSVWWQMFYAIIPFVNLLAFYRIQRLVMAITSAFPLFVGIIVILTLLPNFTYFPFRLEDRFNLFLILFNSVLVFFIRRWSKQWNDQIDRGESPRGDKIDKKVNLIWQLVFSTIPFINFSAFARIHHFGKSVVIGIITYIGMAGISSLIVSNNSTISFYSVYFGLSSSVFLFFMFRWTNRYNSGRWNKWNDNWMNL